MKIQFPMTRGGNVFCGRTWKYNDMDAGFWTLDRIGITDKHPQFGTSPNFFGGNCDKIGWNKESGFGLVIGGTDKGDAVFGVYIDKARLTAEGKKLIKSEFGKDALDEDEEDEPTHEELVEELAKLQKKAEKMGIPSRFINGASASELKDRIAEKKAGANFDEINGDVAVAPPIVKAYDEKASKK